MDPREGCVLAYLLPVLATTINTAICEVDQIDHALFTSLGFPQLGPGRSTERDDSYHLEIFIRESR